jgi:hypothetical protein
MASLANTINYSDVTIYSPSSAKAILYGLQGKFSGKDSAINWVYTQNHATTLILFCIDRRCHCNLNYNRLMDLLRKFQNLMPQNF